VVAAPFIIERFGDTYYNHGLHTRRLRVVRSCYFEGPQRTAEQVKPRQRCLDRASLGAVIAIAVRGRRLHVASTGSAEAFLYSVANDLERRLKRPLAPSEGPAFALQRRSGRFAKGPARDGRQGSCFRFNPPWSTRFRSANSKGIIANSSPQGGKFAPPEIDRRCFKLPGSSDRIAAGIVRNHHPELARCKVALRKPPKRSPSWGTQDNALEAGPKLARSTAS